MPRPTTGSSCWSTFPASSARAIRSPVLFVLNGEQQIGSGDRFIANAIVNDGTPAVTALNKVDRLDRPRTVAALSRAAALGVPGEIFPISARTGDGLGPLVEQLVALLPEGGFLYPPQDTSDMSEQVRLAELVRVRKGWRRDEALLDRLGIE